MKSRTLRHAAPLLALALVPIVGCDRDAPRLITQSRKASSPPHAVKLDATSADRFGAMAPPSGGGGHAAPRKTPLAWQTPQGWKPKPDPSGMRVASFDAGGPEVDCSVSLLPGGAGGLGANVNRWRKQMGLGDASPDEIAKLPQRPILGVQGVVVDLSGSYAGMDGSPRPNMKLLGALAALEVQGVPPFMVFVKLVGPAAAVDAERPRFEALCDSLRFSAGGGEGEPHDHSEHQGQPDPHGAPPPGPNPHGAAPPAPGPGEFATDPNANFKWEAPQGWTQGPARSMRLVTFVTGASECYVAVLPGSAGGTNANLNRWRQQMGQPPLDDAALAALPRASVLGQQVAVVEAQGRFTDMNGQAHDGYTLLGVACTQGERTVFVKMVGPDAEVRAERGRFLAFCGSLR